MATEYPATAATLNSAWAQFLSERSITLCPTSLTSDYRQVTKRLQRNPHQRLEDGRQAVLWELQQQPTASARRVAMFMRAMFKWAATEDVALVPRNPTASLKMPKALQSDHEAATIQREETALVLVAMECNSGPNWALLTELQLQTGQRTGEVFAMRWSDITANTLYIHQNYTLTHGLKTSTKTSRSRRVPLSARSMELLELVPRTDDFVFPSAVWNRNTYQSLFRRRMEALYRRGLIAAIYRPYDLRHTAISRWLEAGISVAECARWAGNTPAVIFQHYCGSTVSSEMPVL